MSFRRQGPIALVGLIAVAFTLAAVTVALTASGLELELGSLGPGQGGLAPGAPAASGEPEAAREQQVRLRLDDEEALASVAALAGWALRSKPDPARLQGVVVAARAEGLAAIGDSLRAHLRRQPGDAAALLEVMSAERDPGVLFQEARVLSGYLGMPELRTETVSWLRTLDAKRLAAALPLLLGRVEDDAVGLEVELWEAHADPTVRGRAAQLLAHLGDRLEPGHRGRAQATAREQLGRPEADVAVVVGAADLLASPDLSRADRDLLAGRLGQARNPAELSALAHALARSGTTPDDLARRLRALRSVATSASVRAACDQVLRTLGAG